MVSPDVGILARPNLNKQEEAQLTGFLEQIPNSDRIYLPEPGQTQALPDHVIAWGGETLFNRLAQHLVDTQQVVLVGQIKKGTNNVFYQNLKDKRHVLDLEAFLDFKAKDLHQNYFYRPGLVGETVFNNQFSTSDYLTSVGDFNEKLRWLPGGLRTRLVTPTLAFTKALREDEEADFLKLWSVVSHIGAVNAFPQQKLHSGLVTQARLLGENHIQRVGNLATTLRCWKNGLTVPANVLEVKSADHFEATISSPRAWIDGETQQNRSLGEVVIRRSEVAFPVVAIGY